MILTKVVTNNFNSDKEIKEKILSGKLNELLLIVPTNRKIRYLKKEIISSTPGKATGKLNIETIGTFSTSLLSETANFNQLSEAVAAVLLRQSFQDSELKYFSHYKKDIPEGTLSRIKNVISEYKKHGITPDRLSAEADLLSGSEQLKARDIAVIYAKYLEICRDLNAYEIGDIYSNLNKISQTEFESSFRKIYPDVDLIIIMGFDEFTSPEIDIINSAADINSSRLFLLFDYHRSNSLIFSHLDKCYDNLINKGFLLLEDVQADKTQFQTLVRDQLFLTASGTKNEYTDENIIKISALNREKEIELIAREIKELIINEKTEPHKICIAFNLISHYSPFIRDIFSVYGIPYNLTDRYPLNTSKPVLSIINFLEILENDFYYKNIFRALSGGFVKLKQISLSNLLKASINLKIIAGYGNWRIRLQDAIYKLTQTNDYDDDPELPEKDVYKKALSDIELLDEILSPFSKKMTLRQFRSNLQDLIYSLDIPAVMVNSYSTEYEENIKAVTTFMDTIDELFEMFELEYGEKERFPLKFYLNNIRAAVASARYNIKEKPGYGVQVTTLNEIRGLKFDYLFISGLTDGDLPTRFMPEIFFSGSYAKSEQYHQVEERYLFYQALCSWQKKLYLTVPRQDDRRELSESTFISEINKVFKVKQKSYMDYSGQIFSKEEFAVELGKYGVDKINYYSEGVDSVNPEVLSKGIYVSKLRSGGGSNYSEYSGFIGGTIDQGLKHRLTEYKERQFSISQLETYAKCPYKYFIERVLGLKPIEEPTEEIEAVEMGRLLHLILFEFYKTLKEKGIRLHKSRPNDFERAEELIFTIARDKIEESGFYSELAFYEKEKVLGINNNRNNSLLYKFLLYEFENSGEFIPEFFEKGFGNIDEPGRENVSNPVVDFKAGDVKVRGKIDRVDVNRQEKTFKVLDYKLSGKKPSPDEISSAVSLQLPLYLYAAAEIIKQELNEDYFPAGAGIYSLKYSEGDFGRKDINFTRKRNLKDEERKELTEKAINNCIEAINKYVNEIAGGKFNLSELPNKESAVCIYCDFKGICRVQEIN
ncbi:MAG: PD-(D/E)XK nuclease family protein [Ignavibacteriaceae bacterium]